MTKFQLTVNMINPLMDWIMSTSFILLDKNFNSNAVDIIVFEPCILLPPRCSLGGGLVTCSQALLRKEQMTLENDEY